MEGFKIRKLIPQEFSFLVEIEFLNSGDRKRYRYPYGDGWEDIEKLKAHISECIANDELKNESGKESLSQIQTQIKGLEVTELELEDIKTKIKGGKNGITATTTTLDKAKDTSE